MEHAQAVIESIAAHQMAMNAAEKLMNVANEHNSAADYKSAKESYWVHYYEIMYLNGHPRPNKKKSKKSQFL
jgi:hypothetical protein